MKICKKCGIEKEFKEFYKHKLMKDGFNNDCKVCISEYWKSTEVKIRRKINRDKYVENCQ